MVEQFLQETEQETRPTSQDRKYLRLSRDGKVFYITEAEAMEEELLTGAHRRLSDEDILVDEWNCRVEEANQLKERISFVHLMIRHDDRRPSQYEPAYNTLWNQYRNAIGSLRELDSEAVSQFRDKVAARVKELEARLNNLSDTWDPDYFDYFERTLACYEKNCDLMTALQARVLDQVWALGHKG